jgi:tetratricopeptide (TPR) repeat protein
MKIKFLYIILFWSANTLFAQNIDSIFQKANENYRKGTYEQALVQYHKIDSLEAFSSDLYYNMGNSYYKLNQIGSSIFYLEKALLTDPGHEDAKHNLIFANRMRLDKFEQLPKSLFQKVNERIIYPFHYNTWAWISVFFAMLTATFFLRYYFTTNTIKKRLFFTSSIFSLLFFVVVLSFTFKAKYHNEHYRFAVLFDSVVSVKSEPNHTASESFQLHEGTKVQILEDLDDWQKIRIPDGKVGWLLSETSKEVK